MALTDDLPATELMETIRRVREDFTRAMLSYRFAMDDVRSRVERLSEEHTQLRSYNPIEHISSRLKTPESVLDKVARKGLDPTLDSIRAIGDVAGVRVICSFTSDLRRVFDALTSQPDVAVLNVKDYVTTPKPNGYRSLHALLEVPVPMSSGAVRVPVEVQLRTVAMDFWASLEHKIFYKFSGDVPEDLLVRLRTAAETAAALDAEMEELHEAVHGPRTEGTEHGETLLSNDVLQRLLQHVNGLPGA